MQFTADTRNATAFELTALAEFVAKLASVAPQAAAGWKVQQAPSGALVAEGPGNMPESFAELVSSNAPTAIPPVPANATGSESQSPVPAVPSDTPATGASAAPAVPNDQKLDSAGFPWDARINTANKGTIGDGTWRKKPGVDAALVESVRAELKAGAAPITDAPAIPAAPDLGNAAATGGIPAVPAQQTDAPAVPTLTAQDVLARCTEIQMSDASKGAALFQAIVSAGVAAGPMGLIAVTDAAVLTACLTAVNAVGAA